jgi:hypothetical protein
MGIELKNGVLRDGSVVGNVKNGVIRKGSSSNAGSGSVVGNVKGGVIRKGSSSNAGGGSTCGKTKDYSFKGASTVGEAESVALYHFLVRSIF